MNKLENISNTALSGLISDWVKCERDRAIMQRRIIDGVRYEPLAEEFDLSVRHVKKIVAENLDKIQKHI